MNLRSLKSSIRRGIKIPVGKLELFLKLDRRPAREAPNLALSYARTLEERFPQLLQVLHVHANSANAEALLGFYLDYLAEIYPPARGARLRSQLYRMRQATSDGELRAIADRLIAISNLSDGVPDRGRVLRDDPEWGDKWRVDLAKFEAAYGSPIVSTNWAGSTRGDTLIAYFENNCAMLRGKSILHFAPEPELRKWFNDNQRKLGISEYVTADGALPNVDFHEDIVDMRLPDKRFDLIVCHRVLEHIPDDARAFSELFRILKPGGVLNFSVPQSPHLAVTTEWVISDESHEGHVRQYGSDMEQRIAAAGFEVRLDDDLLQREESFLRARRAYPMRIFNCSRP